MTLTRIAAAGAAVLALSTVAAWRIAAYAPQELDPLKVASNTHKLLFENQFMRVIQAKVPAGSLEPKHSHPKGLTVYLADYDIEQKAFPDGKVTRAHRTFGTVSWSDAVVHEVRNTGKTNSHAVRIELK
ncbi:MAG TPA: hypothetical protein VHN20_17940 [Beijerinckiaceae bacterium]|nr:hypothetical protein [Beijerinckiaceae bacterium]